jgi:hypothetical protein
MNTASSKVDRSIRGAKAAAEVLGLTQPKVERDRKSPPSAAAHEYYLAGIYNFP